MIARTPSPYHPCSPCTHHHAIEGLDSCYCPDCKRSFARGTAGYKEILERDNFTLHNQTSNELLTVNPDTVNEFPGDKIPLSTLVEESVPSFQASVLRGEDEGQLLGDSIPLSTLVEESVPSFQASVLRGEDEEQIPGLEVPLSTKRNKGQGTGRIQWRPTTKPSGKKYQQAWYDYEVWSKGDRLVKRTRYIPKRLVAKIQELDSKKVPVREILEVLGVKYE